MTYITLLHVTHWSLRVDNEWSEMCCILFKSSFSVLHRLSVLKPTLWRVDLGSRWFALCNCFLTFLRAFCVSNYWLLYLLVCFVVVVVVFVCSDKFLWIWISVLVAEYSFLCRTSSYLYKMLTSKGWWKNMLNFIMILLFSPESTVGKL